MKTILKRILGYFISGLALVLPIILTIWVLYYIVATLDSYLKLQSSMLIFLIAISLIIFLGYISRRYVEHGLWRKAEVSLIRIPLLGMIYKSLKDVTVALIGRDRKFSEPVMVKMHDDDVYKIGFVTNKEVRILLGDFTDSEEKNIFFMVYFPLSFSLSGDLYLVPAHRIKPVKGKAKDVMQTIVSGGIINMD